MYFLIIDFNDEGSPRAHYRGKCAILDAGRSKKRACFSHSPFIYFHLFLLHPSALFSFLATVRILRPPLAVSSIVRSVPSKRKRDGDFSFSLFSPILMPWDRQMIIKKAAERVRELRRHHRLWHPPLLLISSFFIFFYLIYSAPAHT